MWSIEGGSHTVDGVVTFDATRTLDKDDGDRCANNKTILFYRFGTYGVLRRRVGEIGSAACFGITIQLNGDRRNQQTLSKCGKTGISEQNQLEGTSSMSDRGGIATD